MSHILAVAMQKGGVGKTTTTLNLGANLAHRGHKVLLLDTDPQSNLTMGLGVVPKQVEFSIYEVLLNPTKGIEYATLHLNEHLDLVPATLALAGAELDLAGRVARETMLRKALAQAKTQYEFILIDAPPSLGLFTVNALAAATSVLVPLQLHDYAYEAMPQLEATIELVRELNPTLDISGIVGTMAQSRTKLTVEVEGQIRKDYGEKVFKTLIPYTIKLAEAPAARKPISEYAPGNPGDQAYQAFTDEVEARYAKQ